MSKGIETTHKAYDAALPTWTKIEDITRQKNLSRYLVTLNPHDKSPENATRNRQYQERAVFYALAGQTVQGMLGTVFQEWPKFTVPQPLEYLGKNADGAGNSIYQQAQGLTDDVIRKARAGLCVSFPKTEGQVSRADIVRGRVVATIHRFEPEQIINWKLITEGSQVKLGMVVIRETAEEDDGYGVEDVEMLRELYLDDGVYREREWRKNKKTGEWEPGEEFTPTDASGNPWEEIPFLFVGGENNDATIDQASMLGIVELNIGHYRNSADYEDNVFFAGQAQPYMVGVTADFLESMKKQNIYIGSRNLLGVPEGGAFGFAASPPNVQVRQAMLDKVDMMVSLGARMIQPGSGIKTATQAAGEFAIQHSILSLIASNVSEAYTQCLKWCARYMGVGEEEEMEFTLNQDFVKPDADANELREIIAGYVGGAMPAQDFTRWMQSRGYFDKEKEVEEYVEELSETRTPAIELGGI